MEDGILPALAGVPNSFFRSTEPWPKMTVETIARAGRRTYLEETMLLKRKADRFL
jgi:hypothetical protein